MSLALFFVLVVVIDIILLLVIKKIPGYFEGNGLVILVWASIFGAFIAAGSAIVLLYQLLISTLF